jgi:hypothetical protein
LDALEIKVHPREKQKIILYLTDKSEGAEVLRRKMLQDQIEGPPQVPLRQQPDKINLEEIRNISDSSIPDPGSEFFPSRITDHHLRIFVL